MDKLNQTANQFFYLLWQKLFYGQLVVWQKWLQWKCLQQIFYNKTTEHGLVSTWNNSYEIFASNFIVVCLHTVILHKCIQREAKIDVISILGILFYINLIKVLSDQILIGSTETRWYVNLFFPHVNANSFGYYLLMEIK